MSWSDPAAIAKMEAVKDEAVADEDSFEAMLASLRKDIGERPSIETKTMVRFLEVSLPFLEEVRKSKSSEEMGRKLAGTVDGVGLFILSLMKAAGPVTGLAAMLRLTAMIKEAQKDLRA